MREPECVVINGHRELPLSDDIAHGLPQTLVEPTVRGFVNSY